MSKVSVIIPIYNVENYLIKCLDSIINQSHKDLEIICVEDCSFDSSKKIVEEYAAKDNRIKIVYHSKNRGLSAARNTGLDIATGDYIYFLDSDDWIDNDYIFRMVEVIEKSKADIVLNRNIKYAYDDYFEEYKPSNIEIELKDNTYIDIPKYAHGISCTVWTKLYKRELIQQYNLRFPEGFNNEDIFFHYAALGCAKSLYHFKGSVYYYRKRKNSITDNSKENGSDAIKNFEFVYDFYKENDLLARHIKIFYITPSFCINNEETYNSLKEYFKKAEEYILNSGIFNDIECFLCNNILGTKNYKDYINKYHKNVAISFIRKSKTLR